MGKSDRAFIFGLLGAAVALGWLSGLWINIILTVIAALLVYTAVNRVRRGLAEAAVNVGVGTLDTAKESQA
jgi:CDP-diacylglycerol--glycerol-3-phosphate 3-phosphatidyltransferase